MCYWDCNYSYVIEIECKYNCTYIRICVEK